MVVALGSVDTALLVLQGAILDATTQGPTLQEASLHAMTVQGASPQQAFQVGLNAAVSGITGQGNLVDAVHFGQDLTAIAHQYAIWNSVSLFKYLKDPAFEPHRSADANPWPGFLDAGIANTSLMTNLSTVFNQTSSQGLNFDVAAAIETFAFGPNTVLNGLGAMQFPPVPAVNQASLSAVPSFNLSGSLAAGGFLLYPNKANLNMMRSVYRK